MSDPTDVAPATTHGRSTRADVELRVVQVSSFDDLYRSEYRNLVGLAYTLTGRRDVAEELVQDAMLAVYQHWGRVSSYDRPGAWVRRLVVNRAASRWRRQRTAARLAFRLGRPDPQPEPTGDAAAVWGAVRQLPRRQAEVVAMYYGCDMTADEIAETLGCAAGTVRTHLVRARAALAESLGHEEGLGS